MCDNNNFISEISVKQLFQYNIVIPEIQREYVWGNSQIGVKVLKNFFEDILTVFEKYANLQNKVQEEYEKNLQILHQQDIPIPENLREKTEERIISKKISSNIGFLYTYNPDPSAAEKIETVMLIDGQQRMTTIFLLLLFAAYKAGKKDNFYKLIRYEKNRSFAFDFKVRQKTRDFLNLLIDQIFSCPTASFRFSSILDMKWYLEEYKTDVSVSAMVNTLNQWDSQWSTKDYAPDAFYNFLLNRIYFWRYHVPVTIHGEKLYITMNGRGRNLTAAEIIKAEVFRLAGEAKAKNVGKTFEDIYDFFWQHRPSGTFTADGGVQKFFRWVYLLEQYEKYIGQVSSKVSDEDVADEQCCALKNFRDALQRFELKTEYFSNQGITYDHVEHYFYALKQLMDVSNENPATLLYNKKLSDYIFQTAEQKNAFFSQENKSFQQQTFLLLPLIRWISNHNWDGRKQEYILSESDKEDLLRFCRYLCNIRSMRNVQQSINKVTSAAIRLADELTYSGKKITLNNYLASGKIISQTICPVEEIYKAKIYSNNIRSEFLEDWEEKIWNLEDFKFSEIVTTNDSYAIEKILSEYIPGWKSDDFKITSQHVDLLKQCLSALEAFKTQLSDSPDIVYQWLLFDNHLGYVDERSMLVPKSFCQLLETTNVLSSIHDIEKKISQVEDFKSVFAEEELNFIQKYWAVRSEVKEKKIQLAIYISMCRIAGVPALDEAYNKFGYWYNPPYDLKADIHTWCSSESQYVFRSLTNENGRMRHDCINDLLKCHDVDDTIIKKMDAYYGGRLPRIPPTDKLSVG